MIKRILLFALMLVVCVSLSAHALEISGVKLSDKAKVGGKTLALVGAGIRTKTFLRIKVYIGALYMEKAEKNPASIISSDQEKQMVMHFLYHEVSREKLIKGWNEGFEANSRSTLPALKERIDAFNSYFDGSVKKGEEVILTYVPGKGTEVKIKGVVKGTVEGKDFMEALFKIWFGDRPADVDLKREILKQ